MTTVYETAQDIADSAIETLDFYLKNDQISSVFDFRDFLNTEIFRYLDQLFVTADINSLWADLGYPEPEEMGDTISSSIDFAIRCELVTSDKVFDTVILSVNTWASDQLFERKLNTEDIDMEDTEDMVRALA